jgi:signal transduction histidine kinase
MTFPNVLLALVLFAIANVTGLFFIYTYLSKKPLEKPTGANSNEDLIPYGMVNDILEQERTRISTELHDELGTLLSIIHLDLELVMHEASSLTPYGENKLAEVKRNISLVTESIRNNIWNLSSQMFDQVDLTFALRELCHKLDGHKGTHVTFVQSGGSIPISQKEKLNLFRIVQELMTNAIKHSIAWNISVHLHWDEDRLTITTEDDGSGYERRAEKKGSGMGTINITKRANLIGANVEREALSKGLRTVITLKFDKK